MTASAPDDALWAAIGNPSRLRVLDILVASGATTPTVLAAALPLTRQAVSKHLAVLQQAGLVDSRREGRHIRYAIRPERLHAAARALAAVAADWDRRLNARIAEATHKEEKGTLRS